MQITGLLGSSYGTDPLDFVLNLARNHRAQWARAFASASAASNLRYWTAVGGDGQRYSIDLTPSANASAATIAAALLGWSVKRPDALAQGVVSSFAPVGLDGTPAALPSTEEGDGGLSASAIIGLIVVIIPLLAQLLPIVLPPIVEMLGKGLDALPGIGGLGGAPPPAPPPIPPPGATSSSSTSGEKSASDQILDFIKSPIGLGACALGLILLVRSS